MPTSRRGAGKAVAAVALIARLRPLAAARAVALQCAHLAAQVALLRASLVVRRAWRLAPSRQVRAYLVLSAAASQGFQAQQRALSGAWQVSFSRAWAILLAAPRDY